MSVAQLPIVLNTQQIAAFCQERGITRLRLFGSVLRDDFVPGKSDVDVLADFAPGALLRAGWKSFAYGEELGAIFGAEVDLLTAPELSRHYRDEVLKSAVTIYEQA